MEALIALSIMLVAAEIIRSGRGRADLSSGYPWIISYTFSLLHGLGFAGALREIGLPQKDVPLALLTFNFGVEAGQLAAVALVRLLLSFAGRLRFAAACLIGTISASWFVERLAAFG